MAYSSNPITVERMLPYLEPLTEGQECIWRTAPGKARWLAYRVREALAVAREHPERFPVLAARTFKVEVLSDNEVRAVQKGFPLVETVSLLPTPAARSDLSEVSSAQEIIEIWNGMSETARQKVYFPNADLGDQGLLDLHEWAQGAGVLIFENLGSITLLPRSGNEEAADFAWSPDDLDTEPSISWRE